MKKFLALGALMAGLVAPLAWAETIPLLGGGDLPSMMAADKDRPRLTAEDKAAVAATMLRHYKAMTPAEKDKRFRNMLELANSLSPETTAKFRAYAISKLENMQPDKREKIQARFAEKWGELDAAQQLERQTEARKRYAAASVDEQNKFKNLLPKIYTALIAER